MLVQEVPSCTAGNERRLQSKTVSAPMCTFTGTLALWAVDRSQVKCEIEVKFSGQARAAAIINWALAA